MCKTLKGLYQSVISTNHSATEMHHREEGKRKEESLKEQAMKERIQSIQRDISSRRQDNVTERTKKAAHGNS